MGKLSWVGGLGGFNGSDGARERRAAGRRAVESGLVAAPCGDRNAGGARDRRGFLLLFRFYSVVFLFLVAVMLGIATKPVVGWLQKRGVRPEIGVILVYLVLLALVALFLVSSRR